MSVIFRQLVDSETHTFTYLFGDPWSREAILIDPVLENIERDLAHVNQLGLTLRMTLETHVHADHITAASIMRAKTGCQVLVGRNTGAETADRYLDDGDAIRFGLQALEVRETPGHTSGCISFVSATMPYVFTGDTLMIRGCGRTDFQDGCSRTLYRSVRDKLFSLSDDTLVYPAHDYKGRTVSSIREEKLYNPRLGGGRSEEVFVGIMEDLRLGYPRKMDQSLPLNLKCGPTEFDEDATSSECDDWPVERTPTGAPSMLPADALLRYGSVRVVDIREPDEWDGQDGCLQGVDYISQGDLLRASDDWTRSDEVLLVCRSGGRSDSAAKHLEARGFRRVASLKGGVLLWSQMGLPMSGDQQG